MEKIELIPYLLKVTVLLGIFYGFYYLLLRNTSHHTLNRAYLLSTLIIALVIPVLEIHPVEYVEPIEGVESLLWVEYYSNSQIKASITQPSTKLFEWQLVLKLIYLAGCGLFLFRSIIHLVAIYQLKKQSEYVNRQDFRLYKTVRSRPFSFLSSVFVPKHVFGSNSYSQILAHECAHVRQLHSIDRLLVDLMVSLLWFNPFMYLYRNALIEIHEYQADQSVLKVYDIVTYQEALFAELQASYQSGLVSHFNFSMTKKRIVMMNKSKNWKSVILYFVAFPLVIFAVLAFSTKHTEDVFNEIDMEVQDILKPQVIPDQQKDVPSIFPLIIDGNEISYTSDFGKRKSPYNNEEQFHQGYDFGVPEGTEVIATASGEVLRTGSQPYTKGIFVEIKHGDFETRFWHLSKSLVSIGEYVTKGQVIGLVGSTGRSNGIPHLHYAVLWKGEYIDPKEYINNFGLDND